MPDLSYAYHASPIGLIEIGATPDALTSLYFIKEAHHEAGASPILAEATRQLEAYFASDLRDFDLPLAFTGADFQQQVWQHLLTIPYGQAISYQDLADALGNAKAVRAVGAANGQNPISIIAPCHRVVGSNGHLVGYGGGLWRKEWLLRHEGWLLL